MTDTATPYTLPSAHSVEGRVALLAPLYLAPTAWYALVSRYSRVIIDTSMPYDRRMKATHRTSIIDHGTPQTLTAAINKASHRQPLSSVTLSPHGRWWHTHRQTLATAYGRTPYFDYLFPLIAPLLDDNCAGMSLTSLTLRLDAAIRQIIGIHTPVSVTFGDTYDDGGDVPYLSPATHLDTRALAIAGECPDDVDDLRHCPFDTLPGSQSILHTLFALGPDDSRQLLLKQ